MTLAAHATPRDLAHDNSNQGFVTVTDQDDRLFMPPTDCEASDEHPWTPDLADTILSLGGLRRTQPWEADPQGLLHAQVSPLLREGPTKVRYVLEQRDISGVYSEVRTFIHPGPALEYLRRFASEDPTLRIVRRVDTQMLPTDADLTTAPGSEG